MDLSKGRSPFGTCQQCRPQHGRLGEQLKSDGHMNDAYLGCPFSAWKCLPVDTRADGLQSCRSWIIRRTCVGRALHVRPWISDGVLGPVLAAAAGRGRIEIVTVLMFTLRQARHRSDHTLDVE
jgi:hypothetical protein